MDGGFPKGIVKTIFKDVVKEIPERGESIGTKTCQTRCWMAEEFLKILSKVFGKNHRRNLWKSSRRKLWRNSRRFPLTNFWVNLLKNCRKKPAGINPIFYDFFRFCIDQVFLRKLVNEFLRKLFWKFL